MNISGLISTHPPSSASIFVSTTDKRLLYLRPICANKSDERTDAADCGAGRSKMLKKEITNRKIIPTSVIIRFRLSEYVHSPFVVCWHCLFIYVIQFNFRCVKNEIETVSRRFNYVFGD